MMTAAVAIAISILLSLAVAYVLAPRDIPDDPMQNPHGDFPHVE